MQETGIQPRAPGAYLRLAAAIVAGMVAAVMAVPGCRASATGDTAGGSSRGSAAPQDAGHAPVTQAEIAAKVNAEGERLMRDGKDKEAAQKFMEAAARWPDVRYVINDCTAQFRTGNFEPALRTCQSARNYQPSPAQRTAIESLIKQILQAAKQQGIELCDGCIYEPLPDPPPH
jgi:hypothetical protein